MDVTGPLPFLRSGDPVSEVPAYTEMVAKALAPQKGQFTQAAIAANGGTANVEILFPVPFDAPPWVDIIAGNGRIIGLPQLITAAGFRANLNNFTTAASSTFFVTWRATAI